jgi:hypothetical protein
MAKLLKTLTKELELDQNIADAYFNYIVDTQINGQRQQVRDLFNDMRKDDKSDFIKFLMFHDSLEAHKEVLEICIEESLV